jgi:hypothetical protein
MKQVIIMPGGFHPFHAGHYALYQQAQDAFPGADVYVAATNDTSARPFPFAVKEKLAKLAGVNPGKFIQVKSPFQAREVTDHFDPETTQLIFVRSEKDANKPPQAGGVKKDGNPAYLQPYEGQDELAPMNKHAYMAYLPTVEFGPGMTSATEIRTAWPTLDTRRKTALVMSLYPKTQINPKLAATVVKMLDAAMGTTLDESNMLGSVMFRSKPPKLKKIQPAVSRTKDFMKKDFSMTEDEELNEFAPGSGNDRENDPEDVLLRFAKMWYSAPDVATQRRVEQALAKVGWEIGELESEEGGAYVMRIGDDDSDSYIGWSEEQLADQLNEFAPGNGDDGDRYVPPNFGKPYKSRYLRNNQFDIWCETVPGTPAKDIQLKVTVDKFGLDWDGRRWYIDSPGGVHIRWKYGEIPLPGALDQAGNSGHIHDLISDFLNKYRPSDLQDVAKYYGFSSDGKMNEAHLTEFVPDEGGGSRKFIPWPEFIEQVKQIVAKDFDCVENVVKTTIKARFVPHDPMEYGPTMLYSYYETRAGGRNKGAVSTRGSIQVGKYTGGGLTGQIKGKLLTTFSLLKGHPFERHFDLTFDNIYKIANIIMGNTQGALEFKPEQVAEEAGPVEAYGYVYDRRDQRVMWRKTFPSAEAAHAWADSKNATVLGTSPVQQSVDEDYVDEKK